MQGVLLGVGLTMLEQMFAEQTRDASTAQDHKTRNNKRRKTGKSLSKDLDDDDGDDEVYYAGGSSGKRLKGGIGYAGEQKEDASLLLVLSSRDRIYPHLRIQASWRLKLRKP